ncbi:MAG: hypothetical protein IKE63_03540 [Bacilli bacterium]|nr:hypothetical protein [Bacilli bacterium]
MKNKKKIVLFLIIILLIIVVVFSIKLIGNKDSYDKPYIPDGFKIIEKDITKGLVIEDSAGNQYVWIPVDNKNVTLSRKTFVEKINNVSSKGAIERIYYGEEVLNSAINEYKDTKKYYKYSIDYFKNSVKKHGGFYVSRYEIGDSSSDEFRNSDSKSVLVSKKGYVPYNYVSRDEALTLSKKMYKDNENITSTLINSYAWDTLLEYISIKNKNYIFNKTDNKNQDIFKTGESNDVVNNIYDLSGNVSEWTTEYSSVGSYDYIANCVNRGESFNSSKLSPVSRNYNDNVKNKYIGFRVILYF